MLTGTKASAFRRYQHELEDPKATMKALLKTRGIVVLTSGEDPNHGQPQQAGVERFQEPEGNERSLSGKKTFLSFFGQISCL